MPGNQDSWSEEMRKREVLAAEGGVKAQKWSIRIQAIALFLAAMATGAAAWAALQAGRAVETAQRIASDQAAENRFTSAVTSIGGKSTAEQVAGLTLLRRAVEMQITTAINNRGSQQEVWDAYDEYSTALDIIPTYLRDITKPGKAPSLAADYAAAELERTMKMGPRVYEVSKSRANIDLALVGLSGIDWTGVDFTPLGSAWMPKIDLRNADLAKSRWGGAYLENADLRCADLRGADLSHATLSYAKLSGADFAGAKLPPPSQRQHVETKDTVGYAQVPGQANLEPKYNPDKCMASIGQ